MHISRLAYVLRVALPATMIAAASLAHASTLWTGPNITYTEPSSGAADVLVSGAVSLARGGNGALYNAAAGETFSNGSTSPTDTTWAFGTLANFQTLTYQSFAAIRNAHSGGFDAFGSFIANKPMVVHLVSQDIYLSLEFSSWTPGFHTGSGFTYVRSTPAAAPPPTPSVTITNPVSGATFAAPATIAIKANATVSSGTVTNVAFFANSTSLGSVHAAPFDFNANNLTAGTYALTAVAMAAGVSGTSAVVNVTVVAPPSVSITNPVGGAVFAAPASVNIKASASVASGTVTNVSCLVNGVSVGALQTAPFNFTANNLSAGSYAFAAVATASGISTTSAVVSVSVVVPVVISNSPPNVASGVFSFDYTANPGLSYVVLASPDLASWLPLSTNVALASPVHYTDNAVSNAARYYRVQLLPNP